MNPQYFEIIILGAVTAFLVFKLVKSLGVRPDRDEGDETGEDDDNVVDVMPKIKEVKEQEFKNSITATSMIGGSAEENIANEKLKDVFYKIYSVDKGFHPDRFLDGAKAAFSMIIEAFGKDDEDTLKSLVDEKVFDVFKAVLDGYKEKNQKLEQTLIGMKDVKIENAALEGNKAKITVLFETEQAKAVKDTDGKVVEGDSVMISNVKELWTFAKDLKNSSPNWWLVAVKGCQNEG